jgi:hypothetical protein
MDSHDDTAPHQSRRPLALVNARLVDPASGLDAFGGLLVADGVIADLGMHIMEGAVDGAEFLDCGGRTVAPGLIDMMVFSGEPGHEHRETLATASRAAAAGGVTTICCMPNTDPVIDDVALCGSATIAPVWGTSKEQRRVAADTLTREGRRCRDGRRAPPRPRAAVPVARDRPLARPRR